MIKITFMGAGSTVFAKNVLGDVMLSEPLQNSTIALYDIDKNRLEESRVLIEALNKNCNAGRAKIETYLGTENRKAALCNEFQGSPLVYQGFTGEARNKRCTKGDCRNFLSKLFNKRQK